MTAAAQLDRQRVAVNAVHPGLVDTAMLGSAGDDGQLPALEGFAIANAATAAEIPRGVAFSRLPRPRKSHFGGRETATSWVGIIAALETRAVA
jgi:NAD(P)-dependent dehydrogenase (short-subunit alcohol dehydrogenase family)